MKYWQIASCGFWRSGLVPAWSLIVLLSCRRVTLASSFSLQRRVYAASVRHHTVATRWWGRAPGTFSHLQQRTGQETGGIPSNRRFFSSSNIIMGGSMSSSSSSSSKGGASRDVVRVSNTPLAASMVTTTTLPYWQSNMIPTTPERPVHYIFLVHGWLGNDSEMSYLHEALQAAMQTCELVDQSSTVPCVVIHRNMCNNGQTTDGIAAGGDRVAKEVMQIIQSDMLRRLHHPHVSPSQTNGSSSSSNSSSSPARKKSKRMLEENGKRNEASLPLSNTNDDQVLHATVSFVGNSLGGLYARFALSKLPSFVTLDTKEEGHTTTTKVVLDSNVFCTTATPHLGVASHTWLPIPRIAERAIGMGLQKTGVDLFRLDHYDDKGKDLIYTMNTQYDTFLKPLAKFRKRIAYANAFRTDFQVPTDTAAFLSKKSTYPHVHEQFVYEPKPGANKSKKEEAVSAKKANLAEKKRLAKEVPFMAILLETEALDQSTPDFKKRHAALLASSMAQCRGGDDDQTEKDLLRMAVSLDSLGWTKVFVDVRDRILVPGVSIPFLTHKGDARGELEKFITDRHSSNHKDSLPVIVKKKQTEDDDDDNNSKMKKRDSRSEIKIESRELVRLLNLSEMLHVPLGHTVMVANSKSWWYSQLNAKGRPVMDKLAKDLIQQLHISEDKNSTTTIVPQTDDTRKPTNLPHKVTSGRAPLQTETASKSSSK